MPKKLLKHGYFALFHNFLDVFVIMPKLLSKYRCSHCKSCTNALFICFARTFRPSRFARFMGIPLFRTRLRSERVLDRGIYLYSPIVKTRKHCDAKVLKNFSHKLLKCGFCANFNHFLQNFTMIKNPHFVAFGVILLLFNTICYIRFFGRFSPLFRHCL